MATQRDPLGNQPDGKALHKHEIRKVFHKQLKRLWDINLQLKKSTKIWYEMGHPSADEGGGAWCSNKRVSRVDYLADKYSKFGFKFVPLVPENSSLLCSVKILFLRPDVPGGVINSADIDNRLKTLFDAMRMPKNINELGGANAEAGEDPFFCLLEDDSSITRVEVDTDVMLEPLLDRFEPNDARLTIEVSLRPYHTTPFNQVFA